jgi:L-lactate dehydrogenase (cytochrome)
MAVFASVEDYRAAARRRLPHLLFDYIDGGSYSESTLARNTADFESLMVRQRVMRDVSNIGTKTELFGEALSMPVLLGPVGFAGMFARRGEIAAARAAEAAGVQSCPSALSICGYDEIRHAVKRAPWFQLYMIKDRGYMRALIQRVRDAGARVMVFTVDLPVPAARYRDERSGFRTTGLAGFLRQAAQGLAHPGWLWSVYLNGGPHVFGNFAAAVGEKASLGDYWSWCGANFDASVTWADLDFVREIWDGPILIKGVMEVEDARAAVAAGADGVIVSNHGGRQLDGARASISALAPIADAVADRLVVLMDGGVRTGLDVMKALALGARACLLGRAWAYALAARGEAGVAAMLDVMGAELRAAMALSGSPTLADLGPALIDRAAAERAPGLPRPQNVVLNAGIEKRQGA